MSPFRVSSIKRTKFQITSYVLAVLLFIFLCLPGTRLFFQQEGYRWLFIFLFSAFLSFSLTPLVRVMALRLKALDYPDRYRKAHKSPTPILGGVAIYIAFTSSLLVNFVLDAGMKAILLGGTLLMVVGIISDLKQLSTTFRLLSQFLITTLLIFYGVTLNLFPKESLWGLVGNIALTYIWILGITNAFNFIDGMDGLAAGLGVITSFFMGIVAFQTDQPYFGWLAIATLSSCLGFLPFNFRPRQPAEIFLGDSGSTFIGFILAAFAVKGEWADNNPLVSLTAPLLIFGVLIYDMVHITISRLLQGKVATLRQWVEYVGRDHIHHRLESLLRSKKLSVLFIYLVSVCLGLTAIVLRYARSLDAVILLVQGTIIFVIITILEWEGNRRERRRR